MVRFQEQRAPLPQTLRIDKIADEPQILPKTLHFFILCIFFSAASYRCPQM
jgi:hypothetical protein